MRKENIKRMDLSFPSLFDRHRDATPLDLDYATLIASLGAAQAASPTAAAEARLSGIHPAPTEPVEALVALIEGKSGWAASIAVLGGSFHPTAAQFLAGKTA
jgi:hypothetical protein